MKGVFKKDERNDLLVIRTRRWVKENFPNDVTVFNAIAPGWTMVRETRVGWVGRDVGLVFEMFGRTGGRVSITSSEMDMAFEPKNDHLWNGKPVVTKKGKGKKK